MTDLISLDHNGLHYAGYTRDGLAAAGVPNTAIDAAAARLRREHIKTECRRRIYGVASAEAQMNINGAVALAGAKTASQRSAAETALLAAHALAVQWIADMRAAVETLSADPDADFLAEPSWPACPAEVVALAAQF